MINWLTGLWLAVVGAAIGSFANVVAHRVPRGMSVVWKPSHCPKCGHAIRWYDNVPVLGWLWLGGRCRDCRAPISPRYAVVEAAFGAAFGVLAYLDLFSGAVPLPGRPASGARSALVVVWNPDWTLLGWFAYHAAVFAVAATAWLMAADARWSLARRTALLAVAVALLAAPWLLA